MAELFASGRIVDIILALVALEFLFLVLLLRRSETSALSLIPNLLAGAFLMLALRAALTNAEWIWAAAWLAAALIAHLADLYLRLRR